MSDNKKSRWQLCAELFAVFFKIGLLTFGGGYAMIPVISREIGAKRGWITDSELLDVIAVAESTPGPIAVNTSTFVGRNVAGFAGAVCSTFGLVLPSFVIIVLLSFVLEAVQGLKAVTYLFAGIRAGVAALMLRALLTMGKQLPRDIFTLIIAAAAFLCAVLFDFSVIYIIAASALSGLIVFAFSARRAKK